MAKTISLEDVNMGMTFISLVENGVLPIKRNYTLVGDDQALFDAAGTFVVERNVAWAEVPANIKSALILIDAWTKAQAKEDMGL